MATTVQTEMVKTEDGRELCVEIAGEGSRTIIAHNGTPNSRHLYGPLIADAERRDARLVSYDRPGYGRSTPHPGHSVADGARDVRTIAQALGIDRLAVWGISGGGPYAAATAALLPDLVVAAAVVVSIAPWKAPGLDYFSGMGDDNREDTELYFADPEESRRKLAKDREEALAVTPETVTDGWRSLVSDVDAAVINGDFAEYLAYTIKEGLAPGSSGWWDDSASHLTPWGFELESIRVPVKVWHGRHDRFVPFQHGQWLAEHIPGAEAELSENDGHLTMVVNRMPEVHEWLLSHF